MSRDDSKRMRHRQRQAAYDFPNASACRNRLRSTNWRGVLQSQAQQGARSAAATALDQLTEARISRVTKR
jgi:hypothetical protein